MMIDKSLRTVQKVGHISISRVVEMEGPMMRPQDLLPASIPEGIDAHRNWLEPHFITPNGTLIIAIQSLVVQTRHHIILIDTCVGNDKQREMEAWNKLQLPYLQDLRRAGFTRGDIDVVLCTHMHIDHVGWNTVLENGRWVPTFPNARYLFTSKEWDFWKARPPVQAFNRVCIDDSILPVVEAGQAEFVPDDYAIDDEAWLEFAPGHTPGHVALHLASGGKTAVLSGDIMHHPVQVAEPEWAAEYLDVDIDLARETRLKFLDRYAESDVLIYGGHFAAPSAGYIVQNGAKLRFAI